MSYQTAGGKAKSILPASRAGAISDIAARFPALGVAMLLAYDGDDAAIAYLDTLPQTVRTERLPDWVLNGLLGPRRRADPRFQAVMSRRRSPSRP